MTQTANTGKMYDTMSKRDVKNGKVENTWVHPGKITLQKRIAQNDQTNTDNSSVNRFVGDGYYHDWNSHLQIQNSVTRDMGYPRMMK